MKKLEEKKKQSYRLELENESKRKQREVKAYRDVEKKSNRQKNGSGEK